MTALAKGTIVSCSDSTHWSGLEGSYEFYRVKAKFENNADQKHFPFTDKLI